jgi:arginyl-tRNA synthetase
VHLPEGRLKSREGTKVDADEIVEKLSALAAEEIKNRYETLLSPREISRRAKIIALGALKFYIVSIKPDSAINFNPKESLNFTGKTGPYLQYVYARINSIFKKASKYRNNKTRIDFSLLNTAIDKKLIVNLAEFPEVLSGAAENLNPAELANYLYNLAQDFSGFYESEKILKAERDVAAVRLALISAVKIVLERGLALLGIKTLEEM